MPKQRQPIETEPALQEDLEAAVEVVLDAMSWLRETDSALFVALYRAIGNWPVDDRLDG